MLLAFDKTETDNCLERLVPAISLFHLSTANNRRAGGACVAPRSIDQQSFVLHYFIGYTYQCTTNLCFAKITDTTPESPGNGKEQEAVICN
jgi:hypothetical protein